MSLIDRSSKNQARTRRQLQRLGESPDAALGTSTSEGSFFSSSGASQASKDEVGARCKGYFEMVSGIPQALKDEVGALSRGWFLS